MEILLNSAWAALALLIVAFWLRHRTSGSDRGRQIVAILVLIAILFPVISVSDDLMAMQSATEQDSLQRRDYLASSNAHPVLLFAAVVTALGFEMNVDSARFVSARRVPFPSCEQLVLGVTGNRPPPAA